MKIVTSVVLMVGLLVSPVMGAVCTMACGDSSSCCCLGGSGADDVYLSAPNCCEGEYRHADRPDALGDRTLNNWSNRTTVAATAPSVAFAEPYDSGTPEGASPRQHMRPPPSPLFIINASFLI